MKKGMNAMKKWIAIALCALMLVPFAACRKAPEQSSDAAPVPEPKPEESAATDEVPDPEPIGETLSGGWTTADDPALTDETKAIFEKALEELVGVDYEPLALLGTQVVAGTNYCFLARAKVVYPDAPTTYTLVYIYRDLQGEASVLNFAGLPIVPNGDGTTSMPASPGTLMGGWAYADDPEITDAIKDRLNKALEGLGGAAFEPVANLGTQVVAGMNRCLLCKVTPVVPDPISHWALVYVYENLEGGATLNDVIDLSLAVPEGRPFESDGPDQTIGESEDLPGDEPAPGMIAGGWQVSYEPQMTDELNAVFTKALNGLVGVDYEPIACLGTQVVAGTNYCFLAKATVVYPGAMPTLVLVYVYEDLSGGAELMNFADMPVIPNEYGTAEPIPAEETLDGGWAYAEDPAVTDEIRTRFGEALNSYGYLAVYEPVANLGTQVVAGLNRCILVRFTERIPDALPQYKLMYVYEALDGTSEITDVFDFDLGSLCTYGA